MSNFFPHPAQPAQPAQLTLRNQQRKESCPNCLTFGKVYVSILSNNSRFLSCEECGTDQEDWKNWEVSFANIPTNTQKKC